MASAILGLMLSEADAAKLPIRPSTYPAHITLCFLGEAESVNKEKTALIARRVAAYGKPIDGALTGVGRFHGAEKGDAVYASFSSIGINAFREALVQSLERAGVGVSHEYGFTPHVTLTYVEPGAVSPIHSVDPIQLRFNCLTLQIGEERHDFPFLAQKPKIGVRLHKGTLNARVGQITCAFPGCPEVFGLEEGVLSKSIAEHVDEHLE